MAIVKIDGEEVEVLPHEAIDLMHAGVITEDECWDSLGISNIRLLEEINLDVFEKGDFKNYVTP